MTNFSKTARCVTLLWVALASGACTAPAEQAGPGEDHRQSSALDDFGREVFEAFVAGDTVALEALRLSEQEHNGEVYPELPVGRAGTFPVDMAWENIQLRHYRDRRRQLERFEARRATWVGTECRGPVREFDSFHVETDCWVVFEDATVGRARVQMFKDVLVRNGEYLRAFRYYDGEPRLYGASSR